jgi:hypothetical protein
MTLDNGMRDSAICASPMRQSRSLPRSRRGVSLPERELVHWAKCALHHTLCGATNPSPKTETLMAKDSSTTTTNNAGHLQKHENGVNAAFANSHYRPH